ncbi:hypothetical protein JIN84_17185 [Luteolibacter yonseiensis]|uniref:Reverse transcriptase domain-containing protein n=1 Tax=Luteolibacter yonseiensis TaxID=1144680 RepID=A0A934VBK1_9BACT|nr:reverse transcriptase domain-containing protein [Luteolibacter yonseiensis]MBK1817358.1 hypothetical protein [Luteolibacter yonseiensis]
MRKRTIKSGSRKSRDVYSPMDEDYCQAQYYQMGIITPIAESVAHQDTHGFRLGRGVETAIQAVCAAQGKHADAVIIQVDVKDCFNTIPLGVAEEFFTPATWAYVKAVHSRYQEYTRSGAVGIPQGHPIAAGTTNIVISKLLHGVRARYEGVVDIIVYGDDITLTGPRASTRGAREEIRRTLQQQGMALNPAKSRETRTLRNEPIQLLGYELQWLSYDGAPVIRPKQSAYDRLTEGIATAIDLEHAQQIHQGWINAYRLSNDPRHGERVEWATNEGEHLRAARQNTTYGPGNGGTLRTAEDRTKLRR